MDLTLLEYLSGLILPVAPRALYFKFFCFVLFCFVCLFYFCLYRVGSLGVGVDPNGPARQSLPAKDSVELDSRL